MAEPAPSPARPRVTPEVAVSLPVVSDPQLTPDGQHVAFVVGPPYKRGGPGRPSSTPSSIHVAAIAGGPVVQFTGGPRADSTPRWSPDGTLLAFLSDREVDGRREVHVMPRHGGEARCVGSVDGSIPVGRNVDPLAWFPDGRRLAVLVTDPVAPDREERVAAGNDEIEFEEHPRYTRLWELDIDTGRARRISPDGVQVWEFALAPDGSRAAAIVSDLPYEWDWYRGRVAIVGFDGAATRTVFGGRRQVAKPTWTPGGDSVAFLASNWSDRGLDAGTVMIVPADATKAGQARELPGADAVSDTALRWAPDGRLLALANDRGGSGLGWLDLAGASRSWAWRDRAFASAISAVRAVDGALRIAAVIERPTQPGEVYAGTIGDGGVEWTCLTAIHAGWTSLEIGEVRELTWRGRDGLELDGFLVLPPGARGEGPLPLVTLVHGGPTTGVRAAFQDSHRWSRPLANAGFAVFLPNYRGSTGRGLAFAEANIGDMGGEDLQDILRGVDSLVESGIADAGRLGICGWSYGGFMTGWATTQTDRFRAAVAGAAILDWRSFHGRSYLHTWDRIHYADADPYDPTGPHTRFSPLAHVGAVRTPTLLLHGELDEDVPVEQAYLWHRALTDHGIPTRLVVYPREPHGFAEEPHRLDVQRRLIAWFEQYLLG